MLKHLSARDMLTKILSQNPNNIIGKKSGVIRARVLDHINAKIDAAQEKCDAEHARLDAAHREEVDALHRKHFQDRNDVVDRLVKEIIG